MSASGDFKSMLDQLAIMREKVKQADPDFDKAWTQFSAASKKPGSLTTKQKELICVALGLAAHCSYCIAAHVNKAVALGATREEILEVSFVAVSMGGGPALAYVTEVIKACDEFGAK